MSVVSARPYTAQKAQIISDCACFEPGSTKIYSKLF